MNFLAELRRRFAVALDSLEPGAAEFAPLVLPSQDAKFGDYQANCAMPLGKRLGQPPREIAQQLIERLDLGDLCHPPEIAGPGFINLRINDRWLSQQLRRAVDDVERLGIAPTTDPQTYVLDFSSPNVAKPMHVGHIRSTVIGDALRRVLRLLGHRVTTDNHIGDWGTQFGMIIYGYKHFVDEQALQAETVPELSRLYKLVNRLVEYHNTHDQKIPAIEKQIVQQINRIDSLSDTTTLEDPKQQKKAEKRFRQAETQLGDLRRALDAYRRQLAEVEQDEPLAKLATAHPGIAAAVLAETAALHAGDPTNRALWSQFLPPCLEENEKIYRRLGVSFDHTLGESFYHENLAPVVADLRERGLACESDGAICVFLEGENAPLIVQKKDGAFLYATTDLATIQYRMKSWKPDAILYVVDHRQSLHFELLFATAKLWGYGDVELQHISFGTVLGEDGRPYKTRSGTAVGLSGLLDESVERAYKIVSKNDDARPEPMLSADQRHEVARRIGIGAIKYADLAHNRTSDYVFSYDKMLAMTGNTAAYMQYCNARVRSIFTKGDINAETLRSSDQPVLLDSAAERALGLALLQFVEALERVADDYRPNHLTAYLFELASRYSEFFENCPVLKAENNTLRDSRLLLCDLTARTITHGLQLLGIEVVERM